MSEFEESSVVWRQRPIFISSTFRDMHAERDWLRTHVFPHLEEELRKRKHYLEAIDLRIGVDTAHVDTEEARELLVLKVCLNEIKRSRPFLLVLLGDRYGWTPPANRMTAAANEQGLQSDLTGKSVTALEIEFGILKSDPSHRQRSFFFFRKPLPYADMNETQRSMYSDAYSPEPLIQAGYDKLTALKERLTHDPDTSSRVFEYTAQWDPCAGRIAGLTDFGNLVYEKLWAALDEETRAFASLSPPTWQEQERTALAEFLEFRTRIFVGRNELIGRILSIVNTSTIEESDVSSTWGACVVGSSGSGKSAIFAKVHRELEKISDIVLLANATGNTQKGSCVDSMLRRFIDELSLSANIPYLLSNQLSLDEIETTFYSLMRRVSTSRRVVILIDSIEMFESSPRGQHLTWLSPRKWPANARIIVTGTANSGVQAISKHLGIDQINIEPLALSDATEIGRQTWAHYHRDLNPSVFQILTNKIPPNGYPSYGNPLWLTLALEQLSLLDEDDFARADRQFSGSPTERIMALVTDVAGQLPPTIEGLYVWLLRQNEKVFGVSRVRAFTLCLSMGRSGWRDGDLFELVPRISQILSAGQESEMSFGKSMEWTLLTLATIRRGFRAHLVRRGSTDGLDFSHEQMRQAVYLTYLENEPRYRDIHSGIADYLLTLPESDVVRDDQVMYHLLMADARERAALLYAQLKNSFDAPCGSTSTLINLIVEAEGPKSNANLDLVASLADQSHLDIETQLSICERLTYSVAVALSGRVSLHTKLEFISRIAKVVITIQHSDPLLLRSRVLAIACLSEIGRLQRESGNLDLAESTFQNAHSLISSVGDAVFTYPLFDLSTDIILELGRLQYMRGRFSDARQYYDSALSILHEQTRSNEENVLQMQNLLTAYLEIGNILLAQGDNDGALTAYRNAVQGVTSWNDKFSMTATLNSNLSIVYSRIGNVLICRGDLDGALHAYRAYLELEQLALEKDPTNAMNIASVAVAYEKLGNIASARSQTDEALKFYRQSQTYRRTLTQDDPENSSSARDLSVSHNKIGLVEFNCGDLAAAKREFEASLAIMRQLVQRDLTNAVWQYDIVACLNYLALLHAAAFEDERSADYFQKCHKQMLIMQRDGLYLDEQCRLLLSQLDRAQADGYRSLVSSMRCSVPHIKFTTSGYYAP